jgi:hypothetical protein
MKETIQKVKIQVEIDVPTYTSDNGTIVTIHKDKLQSEAGRVLSRMVDGVVEQKESVLKMDRAHLFNQIESDCVGKIYDEQNKETYKEFVHHYITNYYSGHYDVDSLMYESMIDGFDDSDNWTLSVKDFILLHLCSADHTRMDGSPQNCRRVKSLKTIEEQKTFWSWVFDSKMIDPNGKVELSDRIKELNTRKHVRFGSLYNIGFINQTWASLIIQKCFRDKSIETLKWIIDTYGLDLNIAKDNHSIENIHDQYKSSLLPSIIYKIHDIRIHDTYNNGVLVRNWEYDGVTPKKKKGFTKDHMNRLVDFTNYLNKRFPSMDLTFQSWVGDVICYDNMKELFRGMMKPQFSYTPNSGEQESYDELVDLID